MRVVCLLLVIVASACGRDEPTFVSVLAPENTYNTVGPYRVEARVKAPNGVFRLLLRLQQKEGSTAFADLPFDVIEERFDGGEYFVELPGRPVGTVFAYYLLLVDGANEGGGALVTEPAGAPEDLLRFEILER